VTPEEKRAMSALLNVSMRLASAGKRFRRDIEWQMEHEPEKKLTRRQAMYLWFLCDMYRRQIKDEQVLAWSRYRRLYDELPPIYLEGDHREPVERKKKARANVEKYTPACADGHANESQNSLWPSGETPTLKSADGQ
jgi:hypothetical protein